VTAEAGSGHAQKLFPRFEIQPITMKTYRKPRFEPAADPAVEMAEDELWWVLQREAAVRTFGIPLHEAVRGWGLDSFLQATRPEFDRRLPKDVTVFPDDLWPYSWLFVEFYAGRIGGLLNRGADDFFDPHFPPTPEMDGWYQEAASNDPLAALPKDRHQAFRAWCETFGGTHGYAISDTIRHGHVWLITGNTDARQLLPPRIVDLMRGHHEVLHLESGTSFSLTRHQMLGHPDSNQNYTDALAKNKIMLLQIDSDDGIEWCWGDAGRVHFWITPDDLAARNFENIEVTSEC
jgi:Domain of unknown function (DUF1963)